METKTEWIKYCEYMCIHYNELTSKVNTLKVSRGEGECLFKYEIMLFLMQL
jgi:hypothetical protein